MEEQGRVVEVHGQLAKVALQAESACWSCGAKKFCAAGGGALRHLDVENTRGAQVGDTVQIEVRPTGVVMAALSVFVWPIVLLLVGYGIGSSLGGTEGMGIAGALLGLVLGMASLRLVERRWGERRALRPVIARIVHRSIDGSASSEGTEAYVSY